MDAPLIVGRKGIANRSVQVLASGSSETYSEVKPLLDAFSDTVVYTGELGTGTVIKLAHNLVRRGIGLAIGEGLVLGAKAGVDPELLWDCMHWGLDVQLNQLKKHFADTVFTGNYERAGELRHWTVEKGCRPGDRFGPTTRRADAHRGVGRADDDSRHQPRLVGAKHGVAIPAARRGGGYQSAQAVRSTKMTRRLNDRTEHPWLSQCGRAPVH